MIPRKRHTSVSHLFIRITIVVPAIVMFLFSFSCSRADKKLAAAITDRDSLPTMKTLGVTTLISDSGVIRYKIVAEEWLIFDRKKQPYWAFEKGAYLEKYDTAMHVEATIRCDTAYYFEKQKIWKLIGNVLVKNTEGENFFTNLLYWNEDREKVYSEDSIRIEQKNKTITGVGFESNQQFTDYTIRNPKAVIPVKENI
jgi:LPS export ABC transporter protein LptC